MFELLQYAKKTAAITDKGETLSYSQLHDEVEAFESHVPSRGLICCLCKNEIGALIGYVAGICHGHPLIMLDGGRDKDYVTTYIEKYHPDYLWISSEKCSEFNGIVIYERHEYSLMQLSYSTELTKCPLHDELALCLTTSGSTGSPKLVRLTKTNIASNAESIAEYLHITESERPITTLPMYYSFGLSVINSHLIKGATILLTDNNIFSKSFWDFFKFTSPTSIAGVPFTYEMFERMGFFKMELPSLKTMIQAGGKLNAEVVKRYAQYAKETSRQFIVMYGQTEASPRMSYLPFEYALTKSSSIGIPIPGGEFMLYDTTDQVIQEPNVEGELVYKGPNVCMGYAESRADLGKDDENYGILKTGDVAYKDAEGFYYITGRLKRFVKIWGNRINLDSIEQKIMPITPNCACIGDDNKISVFVEDANFVPSIKELMTKTLKIDKSCFTVHVINQIPKAKSGKTQYAELKRSL